MIATILVLMLFASGVAMTAGAQESNKLFLRAKATEDVKIKLSWEVCNDTGVVRYNIYWQEEGFDGVPTWEPNATTTEMKYTIKDLKRTQEYFFMVSAVDSSGNVLAYGEDKNTPGKYAEVGRLKEVNYWAVMAFAGIILVAYLIVLWKIPEYVKKEEMKGGA